MSEAREYECEHYTALAPAKSCLFCDHCTDIIWDFSHGPYVFLCGIAADTRKGMSGECDLFIEDREVCCE